MTCVRGLRDRRGPVHGGSFLRERRIALDCTRAEFPRIFVHEVAHFIWLRLGNRARRSYEDVLRAESRRGPGRTGLERGVAQGRALAPQESRAVPALARILLREFLRHRGVAVRRLEAAPRVHTARRWRARRRWFPKSWEADFVDIIESG